MNSPSVYAPGDYDAMFSDPVRTSAHLEAIARVVGPDDVVVEIGTGVGYFAVAACRAGARHVYAIEREAAALLAEQLVRENGCSDRVTCIRGDANRIALPERGTVLVCDLRAMLPLLGNAIPTIISARERLLVPGARLIPRRDVIRAAPCSAPSHWARVELALGAESHGIVRKPLAAYARTVVHSDRLAADELCAPPTDVATLEYGSITSPDVDAALSWTIERAARVEGIGLWFDADLADGIGFSTAPGQRQSVYGHGFLPFERALDAQPGDELDCRVRAKLVDAAYVFAWDTMFRPVTRGSREVSMRQSSLGALLATPAELAQRQGSYRPAEARMALVRDLLALVNGTRSLAEIAAELVRRHPGRFPDPTAALAWVTRRHAEFTASEDP